MHKSHKLNNDIDLLKKYDKPGPRYTSYPTAPQFNEEFGPSDFKKEIIETNRSGEMSDVSLYFHIPFCKTLCLYCGCHTMITRNKGKIDSYLDYLYREIEMMGSLINPDRKTTQIHWGGGTPNYLEVEKIKTLFSKIRNNFNLDKDAEISIEIDPRTLTPEHLPAIREVGFNRASIGVQDLNELVQKTVHRVQPEEMIQKTVDEIRELGFLSLNFDLIYGLPYQTVESFNETLDRVLAMSPDRFAVYNFAYVPWMKEHQKTLPQDAIPGPEEKLEILQLIIERIKSAGYVYIGMDHFAKPEDELAVALENNTLHRNFQGYTTKRGTEVFAMGVSSISQLKNVYAQNAKEIPEYKQLLDAGKLPTIKGYRLSEDDLMRRFTINEIMCSGRLMKADFEKQFGHNFDEYFSNELQKLDEFIDDGLLIHEDDSLMITERGTLVVRNIAMTFDNYLKKDLQKKQKIYSRTV